MASVLGVLLGAGITGLVLLLRFLFIERYQFIYEIAGKELTGPYVMLRIDKFTGVVHGMNWAGWERIKPHSGYPGTEKPQ